MNNLNNRNAKNDNYSYHIVLISDLDEKYEMWLPKTIEGYFSFDKRSETEFISIVAKQDKWNVFLRRPAYFSNITIDQSYNVVIEDKKILNIEHEDHSYLIYSELVTDSLLTYKNYIVNNNAEIKIGNSNNAEIRYCNPNISPCEAILRRKNGILEIIDDNSKFGVFVNNEKVREATLKLGDVISILGLKIIIGNNSIAVNSISDLVFINETFLSKMNIEYASKSYYDDELYDTQDKYYNRPPRRNVNREEVVISIDGPPMSMNQKSMPLMLRMGSSMVMGGMAAFAGNFTTLLSSVLFPFISSKYTDKQRQEYESLRVTKYNEYLNAKKDEIDKACEEEKIELNRKYPEIGFVMAATRKKRNMWERRPIDDDFLCVRLGEGSKLMSTRIEFPERRFDLEHDELEENMYQIAEKKYIINNIPAVLSLIDFFVIGFRGSKEAVLDYLLQMIVQITSYHSYDEVKTVFLINENDLDKFDCIKYLPHVWDDQNKMRFIATNEAEAYSIGEYIKNQFIDNKDEKSDLKKILKKRPYYLIFAFDKKVFDCHETFKEIMQNEYNQGATFIIAHNELPKETMVVLSLTDGFNGKYTPLTANGGEVTSFKFDAFNQNEAKNTLRIISNTKLRAVTQTQSIPKMITFLELFKSGKVEQLNSYRRWKENNPVVSLATPVGVSADGSDFLLDLHEKRQGPHGLIAGMTGSGKSEFIITYILSLAVNYHPYEVAFVLIDYKGGGLAGAFENEQNGIRLPHLVGTITNLDGASIQRSLMSIESELLRRQRIFNKVKSEVNEGTMDIYSYQKLYRAGLVSEPMPHLFIISDEFAELKQQQPEFMEKLISAARIGRSLGIHLILATQKPSGVVNDQIRSNTKFRVCLRVQDRSDSMDMLKRPEAAELVDTGRFYLQVGYNEYFALGQSAWCGANYEPQDTPVIQKDDAIEFLNVLGQVVTKAKPKVKKIDSGMKQIVAVVKYLSDLAKTHGITAKKLWLPELSSSIEINDLNENNKGTSKMHIHLGLIDDPENQNQFEYGIDFMNCGNMMVVGESGSGKTTTVQSILCALLQKLTPDEFNFYVLDYSSRMMKQFKQLPHCGAVLYEEDSELLDGFFNIINGIIAERKKLFTELGVDNFKAALEIKEIPLILVVIDNISVLSSSKMGESHSYKLHSYMKNSAAYGVKYIITSSHTNEISSRMKQEISERVSLSLKDKYDYSDILNCKVSYIPPEIPGRGLVNVDGRPLEFQSGIIYANFDEKTRNKQLRDLCDFLCELYGNKHSAQQLAVTSETAEFSDFAMQFKPGRIPLGYSGQMKKPIALPLKQFSTLGIYFGNPIGKQKIIDNLMFAAQNENMELWVIKKSKNSIFANDKLDISKFKDADELVCSQENIRILQTALLSVMTNQRDVLEKYYSENNLIENTDSFAKAYGTLNELTKPIMLFIESISEFCENTSDFLLMGFSNLFSKAKFRNVYIIGCMEPNDDENNLNNELVSVFAKGESLLFGGNFDKQKVYSLPEGVRYMKQIPYNTAVFQYRKKWFDLLMPCGNIEEEFVDEDIMDIIE